MGGLSGESWDSGDSGDSGDRRDGNPAIRFDRNEIAGAFGDLGTDLPLIVGMVLAAGLDSASVLVTFGLMQVGTGLVYRLPMPVQPLKAVAVLVITQKIAPPIIYGAGFAIGIAMLLLAVLGLLDWLTRVIPGVVIRGVQLGLGIQLASLALRDYVTADGTVGWVLAAVAFAIAVVLVGNRRLPPALPILALGAVYAFLFHLDLRTLAEAAGFRLPALRTPQPADIATGFLLLALPQVPLSLGNSILATKQVVGDFFPDARLGVRKIGLTYAAMNLISPFLGGVPTCHGSGGIVGHYTFGARTGGSVIIEGLVYLTLGLFFSGAFAEVVKVFPLPMLGVLLLFEAIGLMLLVRDVGEGKPGFAIALLVGLCAAFLPYGYVVGLVLGTGLYYLGQKNLVGIGR